MSAHKVGVENDSGLSVQVALRAEDSAMEILALHNTQPGCLYTHGSVTATHDG